MSAWYILPNGNIKHTDGLELQPEHDWFPTVQSLEIYTQIMREQGNSETGIIKCVMALALECEAWAQDNLS